MVILYILIQTVSQGILGPNLVNHKATPLAETARTSMGTFGYALLTIGAMVSMFGMVCGDLLNSPRVLYALARDRVIPIKTLAKIHPKFATPYVAIIVHACLVFLIASTGSFEQLVVIATSSILLLYLGVALSVIKLRKVQKTEIEDFKIPGGLTVPVLSIGIIMYFLSNLSRKEMIATVIFIGLLSLVFFMMKTLKKKKT